MKLHNVLGCGFLENVYENALLLELKKRRHHIEQQFPMDVHYDGQSVGKYFADLVVDSKIIIELKAVEQLSGKHKMQLINYLKATDMKIGLLINFGSDSLQYKRFANIY